jgi:hypothetical protein
MKLTLISKSTSYQVKQNSKQVVSPLHGSVQVVTPFQVAAWSCHAEVGCLRDASRPPTKRNCSRSTTKFCPLHNLSILEKATTAPATPRFHRCLVLPAGLSSSVHWLLSLWRLQFSHIISRSCSQPAFVLKASEWKSDCQILPRSFSRSLATWKTSGMSTGGCLLSQGLCSSLLRVTRLD